MRLPRFRLRTLMIAVAIAAALTAIEAVLLRKSIDLVRTRDEVPWREAVPVWLVLNVLFVSPICAGIVSLLLRSERKATAEPASGDSRSERDPE